MTATGYDIYKRSAINIVHSKEKMLLMLYEGAVRFVKLASMGIDEKNAKTRGENISKVIGILTELDCALDRRAGGDIVENLSGLYRYMVDRLTHANVKNDPDALDEVERLLTELKDGFEEAAQKIVPVQAKTKEPEKGEEEGVCLAI
jgi:flagellar protein FliS